jgi:hypothetical protein
VQIRSLSRCVVVVAALVLASSAAATDKPTAPDFGPNVKILHPGLSTADIKATLDSISKQQVSEFGTGRYAVLFMPGTYGSAVSPLNFEVGYYEEVAGLGASPRDVTITGTADVHNQCNSKGCFALPNFWRSLSNLTIHIDTSRKSGCDRAGNFWAVSQGAPLRRVQIDNGFFSLMDFCTGPSYASGGFIADSVIPGDVLNGSQQQFLVRNSTVGKWSNAVWNQVFAGVHGAPAQTFPSPRYTTLATNPVSREKPYLYVEASKHFNVFVPRAQTNSAGPTWTSGPTPGHSIAIEDFFIAKPTDTVQTINDALSRGLNLILTPGVYEIDKTIEVKRPNTVVLGLGLATLRAVNGVIPMTVADVKGVDISGLIFDAGPVKSPTLLRFGDPLRDDGIGDVHNEADAMDPGALQDVYFRIGGPHVGKVDVALVVNRNDTILDNIWAWRSDHGNGIGWTSNTATNGVIVNGDNVTATGFFVEHFQQYNVIWNGENGKTIMFQNELPYDPPNQAAYQHDGLLGWAAYKVADSVKTHKGWGLGSYCYFNVDPSIHNSRAFEVPVAQDVRLHNILALSINAGTIDHVVNDHGPATPPGVIPVDVISYPQEAR